MRWLITLIALLTMECTSEPKPKFADAAEVLCEGLGEMPFIHAGAQHVHSLIEQKKYAGALDASYALVRMHGKSGSTEGTRQLAALVILLESIVKGEDKHAR